MTGKAYYFMVSPVHFQQPVKIFGNGLFSCLAVLITAAGLQGEKPLVDRIM